MDSKRVVTVFFVSNDLRIGGAEKLIVALLNGIDNTRFRLHLGCLNPLDHAADLLPYLSQERLAGFVRFDRRSRLDLGVVLRFARYIKEHAIDIVVANTEYGMIYAYLARIMSGRHPKLVEIYQTTVLPNWYERLKMAAVYRHLFSRFDCIVYVCDNQRHYWSHSRRMQVKKAITIHNGIDPSFFQHEGDNRHRTIVRQEFGFEDDDYLLGICAVLRPEKRHMDLVAAVASCRIKGVMVKLLIIGDGPERTSVERAIQGTGLAKAVRITGFQTDVRPYLGACDALVMASSSVETFSYAILEAMAMSKPVVSTRIGGASEQIEDGVTGFLFTPGDVDDLSHRIEQLADRSLRDRMGAAARQKLEREFTHTKMIAAYEELLTTLA